MSQLASIIQRLEVMKNNVDAEEAPQRLFEVNGRVLCQVKYFSANTTFEVEEYDKNKNVNRYQFDDIDIAAIEIFEIIQEEKNSL